MRRSRFARPFARVLAIALGAVAALSVLQTPASAAVPDHVLYWNDVLLRTFRQVGGAPGPLARAGAMMHGAIYDAANSVACKNPPPVSTGAPTDPCIGTAYLLKYNDKTTTVPVMETAIDYAAYNVLKSVFPSLNFDADLASAQAGFGSSAAQSAGIVYGQKTAAAMISARTNDGSGDTTPYVPGTNPGDWRDSGSGPAATPNWGKVKPFSMTSSSQFRPALPGGFSTMTQILTSSLYATQLDEVRRLGSANSTERTADQTQLAWFWANDLDRTYKPPGQLFAHTRIVSANRQLNQRANARLFAFVGLAMGDAGIASWDAKYDTAIDLWRPETAIRLADTDGNPATNVDPSWQPLSATEEGVRFSPPFPAYVSGHATFAAAWAGAMRGYFGTDAVTFAATTEDPHAPLLVTRTFTSFSAAATENALSRIYLGVHFRWDADQGLATGTSIATQLTNSYLRVWHVYDADAGTGCNTAGQQLVTSGTFGEYQCIWDENTSSTRLWVR